MIWLKYCSLSVKLNNNHPLNYLSISHIIPLGNMGALLDLELHLQSVSITITVVSSSPAHDEVYSILHYVIKFVSDLRQVGCFLRILRCHPPLKLTERYN